MGPTLLEVINRAPFSSTNGLCLFLSSSAPRPPLQIENRNSLDVELFEYAAGLVKSRLSETGSGTSSLAPLPCSGVPGATCWDGIRGNLPHVDPALVGYV